jgi:protein gp37
MNPRRIFVNSMSDLFHDDVPFEFVDEVLRTATATPRHTYMILTKRAERMAAFFKQFADRDYVGSTALWFGVSVENQAQAERRIPILYQVPAAVKFVSVEPMLGPIDLSGYLSKKRGPLVPRSFELWASSRMIDWIICGPETGPGARPFDLDWARDLRDQCQSVVVPFFYKGKKSPKDLRVQEVP